MANSSLALLATPVPRSKHNILFGSYYCFDFEKVFLTNLYQELKNKVQKMDTRLSVSWSAYQKNICNGFSFLQQRGEYVDMTLAADGHHVQVHKMVLCLVSPYIKELVAATQCAHPVIFLNNVSSATLEYILEYVYTGEALVPKENIKEFLQACKSLNIRGLEHTSTVEQCQELEQNISQGTGLTKAVEEEDPIATSFDDGHHVDTEYYIEDNDQEMTISNETNISSIQTDTKKPQQLRNTISPNTIPGNETRVQYTISVYGQLQIILNRYLYSFHYRRNRTDDMVWRCLSNREGCTATVITKDGKVVRRLKAHNHPFADKSILKRLRKGLVYSELNEVQDIMEANKKNKQANTSSNLSMINLDDDD